MKKVEVIPVGIASLSKRLEYWIEKLDLGLKLLQLQKTSLLDTAHILRKLLQTGGKDEA